MTHDEHQAQSLWQAWKAYDVDPEHSIAFFEQVEHLLARQALSATLDALFEITPPLADTDTMYRLVTCCQDMAQQLCLDNAREPARNLQAQLVAIPMGGTRPAACDGLEIDEHFWALMESQLHVEFSARAKRALGEPLALSILPLPTVVHPEACAQLSIDDLRALTQEIVEQQSGPQIRRLEANHARFSTLLDTPEHMLGQRMGVAVIVFDAAQFPDDEDVTDWLVTVDCTTSQWSDQFGSDQRWVMGPADMCSAMANALWQYLRVQVDQARAVRHLPLDSMDVTWQQADEDPQTGVIKLHPVADGVELEPIEVSGAWFSLIGPENTAQVLGMWTLGAEPEGCGGEEPEEEPTPAARRQRLH